MNYLYDVELVTLNKIHNKYLDIDELKYQNFLKCELGKEMKKNYDLDINIRDLYPIDIHIQNKDKYDIQLFNKLNEFILLYDKRISRRITKKSIVYKKDKSKSILSIELTKTEHIKIYILLDEFSDDKLKRFVKISHNTKAPFKRCMTVNDEDDLNYLINLLKNYLKYELS